MNAARATKKTADTVPDHLRELNEELPLTLTLQEAASCMKMHVRSVQRLIASGELRATRSKLGGSSRPVITRSEIIRWFASREIRVTDLG